MGYKLFGYVVWKGGGWYLRRRFPDARRNLAVAGIGVLLLAGAAAAVGARRRASAG